MSGAAALAAVKRMQGALRQLARVPSQAAAAACPEIADLIEDEFDQGADPYGTQWAPLRPYTIQKGRANPPLTDTGAMREGITVQPSSGAGIVVTSEEPYLAFHQVGFTNAWSGYYAAPRRVLPERTIPDTWKRAIADAVQEAGSRTLADAGVL